MLSEPSRSLDAALWAQRCSISRLELDQGPGWTVCRHLACMLLHSLGGGDKNCWPPSCLNSRLIKLRCCWELSYRKQLYNIYVEWIILRVKHITEMIFVIVWLTEMGWFRDGEKQKVYPLWNHPCLQAGKLILPTNICWILNYIISWQVMRVWTICNFGGWCQ